jgi:outer membrane lipoprotein carrier protein
VPDESVAAAVRHYLVRASSARFGVDMLDNFFSFFATAFAAMPAPAARPPAAAPVPAVVSPAVIAPIAPGDTLPSVTRGVESLALFPGLPSVIRVAAAPTADEVVVKVQAFYANVKHLRAKFRQEVTNATFGDKKVSDGRVFIAKPGKMRWDYDSKPRKGQPATVEKSFISNGDYLYVVEHENKQVAKKNLKRDLTPVAVSFLYGKGDLRTEFIAALDAPGAWGAAKGDIVLKLTPKQTSAQYKNLFLVVDGVTYQVKQSIVVDSSDNVNHFRFFEPDLVKPIEDRWFLFDERKVPNYRIIDVDQQQGARP